jgi:hypothetical protein
MGFLLLICLCSGVMVIFRSSLLDFDSVTGNLNLSTDVLANSDPSPQLHHLVEAKSYLSGNFFTILFFDCSVKLSSWASSKLCMSDNGTLPRLWICCRTCCLKVLRLKT